MPHIEVLHPGQSLFDSMQAERRLAPRSSSLAHAGDAGVRVRVIVSGWAFRYRTLHDGRRQILDVLLPGDTFGLETLFDHRTEASVQTATPMTYFALAPESLAQAFDLSPEFRRHLMNVVFAQKAALENLVIRLGQCDAEERTAELLLSLHTRLVQCGLALGPSFVLELTQQEMADALGLHVIHLNRVLGRLRARKLVSANGKTVTLHDLQGLAELVPPLSQTGALPGLLPTKGFSDCFVVQNP